MGSHGHEGEGFWAQLGELLRSGPHWAFEIISDIVVGLVFSVAGYFVAKTRFKSWLRKHDREVHGTHDPTCICPIDWDHRCPAHGDDAHDYH